MPLYSLENLDEDEIGSALDRAFASEVPGGAEAAGETLPTLELTAADLAVEGSAETAPTWYLGIGEPPLGPVSRIAVRDLWSKGEITADTLCWQTGFGDWQPIWRVKELASVALEERTLSTLRTLDREPQTPAGLKDQLSALAHDEMTQMAREPEAPAPVEEVAPAPALVAPSTVASQVAATAESLWSARAEGPVGVPQEVEPPAAAPLHPAFVALVAVGATVALMLLGVVFLLLVRPAALRSRPSAALPVAAAPALRTPAPGTSGALPPTRTLRPVVLGATPKPAAPAKPVTLPATPENPGPALEKKAAPPVEPPPSAEADFEKAFGETPESAAPAGRTAKESAPVAKAAAALPESLSQADVFAVVLAQKASADGCIAEQHRRAGSEGGATVMRWTIHPNGKVSGVAPAHEDPTQAAFAACLAAQIKGWNFPRHTAQGEPVEFPFRY